MKDLTNALKDIPFIKEAHETMSKGQMINCEVTYIYKNGKESTAVLGSLVRTQDPVEALEKYNEYSKQGKFTLWVFDIIFYKNKFVGNLEYLERYKIIQNNLDVNIPEIIYDWHDHLDEYKKKSWEGLVLRLDGESQITYTLNGKADRAGAYKFKFMKEGDFIVTAVDYGKGKFEDVYAVFSLSQIKDGEQIDCGNAGPGTLTYEYTSEINSGKMPIPFVVEVEFRDWQEDSFKLEHPVIQRVRWDKTPEECIYE
jgi:ATP-dependent DNA ligase